jgi:hypothetical protein
MTATFSDGPGWYPDVTGSFDSRYWDGTGWTAAVMNGGRTEVDPHFEQPAPLPAAAATSASPPGGQQPALADATAFPHVDLGPASIVRHTALDPATAQRTISNLVAGHGLTVTSARPGRIDVSIAVTAKPKVNWALFVLLCLLWIIPGLIYLVIKLSGQDRSRTLPVTFTVSAQGYGALIQGYGPPETYWLLNAAAQQVSA